MSQGRLVIAIFTHDLGAPKVVDEENIAYPKRIRLHKDTGFQGYEPAVKKTYQPKINPLSVLQTNMSHIKSVGVIIAKTLLDAHATSVLAQTSATGDLV